MKLLRIGKNLELIKTINQQQNKTAFRLNNKNIKDEDRKIIEEIMANMECPHDFECAKEDFTILSPVKDFGAIDYIQCLDSNYLDCPFSISFEKFFFCSCPLRVFLAKELKI